GAETGAPCLAVEFNRVDSVDPQAIADAVEPREVGAGLGRGDDVISGNRVLRVRQGNLDDLRTQLFQLLHRRVDRLLYLRIKSANHVLLRQAQLQSRNIAGQAGDIIQHRLRDAR